MPDKTASFGMESNENDEKSPKKQAVEIYEDRLSQLSDPILHLILSPLYTNDVMKICTFGRRWRNVWTTMPYLRLADGFFLGEESDIKFKRYVSKLFASRDDSCDVHTFRMGWFKKFDPEIFNSWVQYLVDHHVRILEVDAGECNELLNFPDSFFTCGSLEEVSFSCAERSSLYAPSFTSLPHLTRLCLSNVILRSSIELFIDKCPLLEELNMHECVIDEAKISSNKLRKLILRDCRIFGTTMKIFCPFLGSLIYTSNQTLKDGRRKCHTLKLKNLSCLHDVLIVNDIGEIDIWRDFTMITELSNAENIELLTFGMEFICRISNAVLLPTFSKLKRLTLGRFLELNRLKEVKHIIRCAPFLEMFTLKGRKDVLSWYSVHLDAPKLKNKRVIGSCLRTVEFQIEEVNDLKYVRMLVKQLLPNPKIADIQTTHHHLKNCT